MKKISVIFIAIFGLWGCTSMPCCTLSDVSASPAEKTGPNMYSQVQLPVPSSKEAKQDLGLNETDATFALTQVSADYLLVEVFSVSCPYCQREAKQMVALSGLIKSNGLSQKIKIIGIGMANSEFEVDIYRKKFSIPFPLVADEDSKGYKLVGRVGIPHIMILKRDDKGQFEQIYSNSHETRSANDLWSLIQKLTGLKGPA